MSTSKGRTDTHTHTISYDFPFILEIPVVLASMRRPNREILTARTAKVTVHKESHG